MEVEEPIFSRFLAFLHPVGMSYTAVPAALIYLVIWFAMILYWKIRPFGSGIGLACIVGIYAYAETTWRNAAIEKWKYGLPGTGHQNPRKLGLK